MFKALLFGRPGPDVFSDFYRSSLFPVLPLQFGSLNDYTPLHFGLAFPFLRLAPGG